MDYRVQIETFDGPLDLLLYLVRKQEVDICDLPIAAIAAQFLDFLEVLQSIDLDAIGDFVVLASSLIEIKSRLVLPENAEVAEMVEHVEDPRTDLVKQLMEYKRFKDASRLLEDQSMEWQLRYPRLSDDSPRGRNNPAEDLIKEVELWDLVSALSRVLRSNTETQPSTIIYDETPIGLYIEQLREQVLLKGSVPFSDFFKGTNSRSKIVGIFLAVLELLRHYGFRAEQQAAYGEIWVLPPRRPDELPPAPAAESEPVPTPIVMAEEGPSVFGGDSDAAVGLLDAPEFDVPDLSHLGIEENPSAPDAEESA